MYYSWRNKGGLKCKGQLSVQKREGQSVREKILGTSMLALAEETATLEKETIDWVFFIQRLVLWTGLTIFLANDFHFYFCCII